MPVLKNSRWETYAHERAKGVSPVDAARAAGFAHPGVDCARLNKTPAVKERIAELEPQYTQQRVAASIEETLNDADRIVVELWDIHNESKIAKDRANRLRALDQITKIRGLYVQRIDANISSPLDRLNADALQRFLAALDGPVIDGHAEPAMAIEQASEHA